MDLAKRELPLEGTISPHRRRMALDGNNRYHCAMNRSLSTRQIEDTCRELLRARRRVGVREVMAELHRRYGAGGRTERVARILKTMEEGAAAQWTSLDPNVAQLLERVAAAEARAARAEELERHHQDYWANRYAEKLAALERHYAQQPARTGIAPEQYLRLQQRALELARRLQHYEPVGEGIEQPASTRR